MHIIIIRACAVGDFILNLPALAALQESEPSAQFTLVGYPSTLEIAREFVRVPTIHSIDVEPWRNLFQGPIPDLQSFDRAIVWMKNPVVAENLRASGVPHVVAAEPFPQTGHAGTHLLQTLDLQRPVLPDRWRNRSDQIILHPGSGSVRKCWPHFRPLADRLDNPVFLIGPLESEFNTGKHARLEDMPLRKVANILTCCRAFIGNDSGITHLAAYLGVPTIAIFGPTDPEVWGPVGRRASVLHKADLAAIHVDEVLSRLKML